MVPTWLTVVAWLYLSVSFCCAGIISYDIAGKQRRQPMGVMNFVFPITALYLGPFALAFYWRWGRAAPRAAMTPMAISGAAAQSPAAELAVGGIEVHEHAHHGMAHGMADGMAHGMADSMADGMADSMAAAVGPGGANEPAPPGGRPRPRWVTMAIEVSHCGSGCVAGDVISEFAIFALGLTIAGATLGAEYAGDYVLALAFGIAFQYFAIAPMRGLGLKDGLTAAAKADFISLTAFEVGLFGWMAVMTFVLFPAPHHLAPGSAAFWLLMQAGMGIGFATAFPANVWLVNRGIKAPM